MTSKQ